MTRFFKITFLIFFVLAAVFFVYQKKLSNRGVGPDLTVLKQSIARPANMANNSLGPEQLEDIELKLQAAQSEVLRSDFGNLKALSDVANLKRLFGDLSGAVDVWKFVTLERPQSALGYASLAEIYHYDLRQFVDAEKNYLSALANDPHDINTIRNFFALNNVDLKDRARAEGLLLKAIEDNPETADLYALLGKFYLDADFKSKAIEYYQKAFDRNPENGSLKAEIEKLRAEP